MTAAERHQTAILKAVKGGNTTVPEIVRATKMQAHQVRRYASELVKAGKLSRQLELVGERLSRSRACRYSLVR